jgi:cytoskeletal protein CcmA (bactofilin family)
VIQVALRRRLRQVTFGGLFRLRQGEILMSNPYDSATERASILGPTLYFKGDLSAEEDLLIQGRVEGSITHTQRLTVGPQGTVKANIKAQLIIVEGTVEGDLQAEKSVFVKETAKVCGNIFAPTVSILEGANFSGSIDMDGKKAAQSLGKHDPVQVRTVKPSTNAA